MKRLIHLIALAITVNGLAQVPDDQDFFIMEEDIIEVSEPETETRNAGYYQENGKYGFVPSDGKRQGAIYDQIRYATGGFIVKKSGSFGITDSQGELLTKIKFDSIGILNNSYLVKKKNRYGVFSKEGNTILPIKYREILGGNEDITLIKNKRDKVQLISNKTKKILIEELEYCELYKNVAIVKASGRFGLVDTRTVIPTQYDSIAIDISKNPKAVRQTRKNPYYFSNRLSSLKKIQEVILFEGDKVGLADVEGRILYNPEYNKISINYIQGIHLVTKNDSTSIYFKASKKKTDFEYKYVSSLDHKYITADLDGLSGAFDLRGNVIVPFEYDVRSIRPFRNFGFQVARNRKIGLLSEEGKTILPTEYDKIDSFYDSDFNDFKIIRSGDKSGVINRDGTFILPVAYDWIGNEKDVFIVRDNDRYGLFDKKGQNLIPLKYKFITDTDTYKSEVLILKINDSTYNFANKDYQKILKNDVSSFGYILDIHKLNNPLSDNSQFLLYVKNEEGKMGLINESREELVVPLIYDDILQSFSSNSHTYYGVRLGTKYGVINEEGEVILPIKYDDINLDLVDLPYQRSNDGRDNEVIVAQGDKYGVVDLNGQIKVPFQYKSIERLTITGIYKAKKDNRGYQLLNSDKKLISPDYFDEVALFEFLGRYGNNDMPLEQALTFRDGMMRVIDQNGKYLSRPIKMEPHLGYKTFDALKFALIEALQQNSDILLKDFVNKISPSDHLLYYLKKNRFSGQPLNYVNQTFIKQRYLEELKKYNSMRFYDQSSSTNSYPRLSQVEDYTMYRDGYVTNRRFKDHAYGDTKYMERFLRNAIKINGYWISTYFMKHRF